ncbi:hypothetical protein [Aliiruegeria sabulilitoris]|uniref:hypothetical protein n=1 Tax=Aliiruegeria sabulilitoris TaxID=1510458 RepID=UPI000830EE69|nr:hypothetical protein [Aliiruegeria sabulilitoris]NDR57627.1 hypothetical protein [Pseudoruegeria sp. M32A2M]
MAVCVLLFLFLPFAPEQALSEQAAHGLAWNRSGLPAVFPLQVKTREGQDFFLTLEEADTGTPVMGAHIEGGRFFKLLVPPGTYHLRFDPAEKGASLLQGLRLPEPLIFQTRGSGKKAGHIVDISELTSDRPDGAKIRPQSICQVLEQDIVSRFPGREFDASGKPLPYRPRDWSDYPSVNIRAYYCD